MKVSTRGRYALRFMLDLALNDQEQQYIPLKEVAQRQGISEKYLPYRQHHPQPGGDFPATPPVLSPPYPA